MNPHPATPSHVLRTAPRRGVTLIELLIVAAVLLVVLGSLLPSFRGVFERREMEAAAAQWQMDLVHAKTLASSMNRSVRVGFFDDAVRGSCYVVYAGPLGGCGCAPERGAVQPTCANGAQAHRVAQFGNGAAVRLQANVRTMTIDEDLNTVTPTGTLRWQTAGSGGLNQVVNLHGRVRICSPEGRVPGYRRC
jgi:type IV fimbrial biogenesis protein FimT